MEAPGAGGRGAKIERRRRAQVESSAVGARIEAPKAPRGRCGEGVSPSQTGRVCGGDCASSLEN